MKNRYRRIACILLLSLLSATAMAARNVTTLNFRGTDINAVISSVADITGKNFIVDPRVKGKVTIISTKPMRQGEVYQVFLSVLEVHGFTAIETGEVTKIVPDADAKHSGMPAVGEDTKSKGDEAITRVIQVEHVTAAQLVPILRPLVPPQGHLAAYPQSNVLIVSDRARNIERLLTIIQRIDQPSSGEIEIVPLEFAAAGDLVRVLTSLQQQTKKGKQPAGQLTLVADERTNSILIGGDRGQRIQMRAIISHLDTPSEIEGDTHVIYLRYAKAKDLVPVLTGVGDSKKQALKAGGAKGAKAARPARSSAAGSSILNIQADESANALVITAPPALFKSLESVVRQLDVRRAQVLIEAIIAEVSTDNQAEFGVQWLLDGSGGDKPIGVSNFSGSSGSISSIGASVAAGGVPSFGEGLTLALGRFNSATFNFAGIIRALEGDSDTNVLSTPSIVTMDNEEAEIFIGDEVSIPSGSFTNASSGGGSNPFTTFDRVPVGISLKVKPQINEGDAIRLDIEQSVDSIAAGSAGSADVRTSERTIKTSVMVDDGKVLVLGGLVKDDMIESQQKVPLLGDIPILGYLFRHKSVRKVKTNLMVFLRPVIMRDAKRGTVLTNSKYNYIRDLQLQMEEDGVPLLSEEKVPIMPEMESFMELPPPFEDAATKRAQELKFNDRDVTSIPTLETEPEQELSVPDFE